ncbi:hypothetical protein VTL71DRAFT_14059 [Oculimacula yallundae]|uniref:Uncharacterized protein n=1 Tax=Oculimacula yallundae TaxID=86028 RepID=A0ABR4CIR7_9HELO
MATTTIFVGENTLPAEY